MPPRTARRCRHEGAATLDALRSLESGDDAPVRRFDPRAEPRRGVTAPLRLLPLGTNGYFPAHGRQTMSYLLTAPGVALVLDAGTGLGRLAEPEVRAVIESVERLDILLTHYHLDHVVGLSFLPGLWAGRAVRIFAPAPPLTVGGSEALDRLIAPPLFPVGFSRWPLAVEIVPYSGTRLDISGLSLALRTQKHPGGSVGVRIDDRLAYVTDTVMDPGTVAFVRGVGTLLHEVWLTDEEAEKDDAGRTGHSAAGAVAELAREARVGRLIPVHHHPGRSAADLDVLRAVLAARAGCPVELPFEGRAIDLG